MWLKHEFLNAVDDVAKIRYIDQTEAARWNAQRDPSEPRLFTGWCWYAGARHQQGFKSKSAAYRDAWYVLVRNRVAPINRAPRLKVVRGAA